MKNNNYYILIGTMGIVFCLGSLYSFPIIANVIAENNNLSNIQALLPFMISLLVAFVFMFIGGVLSDLGKEKILIIGGILIYNLSFTSLIFENHMINTVIYGLLGSVALNLTYAAATSNIIRTFNKNEGVYLSMVTGMMVVGTVFTNTLFNNMNLRVGYRYTMFLLSLIAFLITALSIMLLKKGFADKEITAKSNVLSKEALMSHTKYMFFDSKFYIILFILILGSLPGLMISSDIISFTSFMKHSNQAAVTASNIFTISRFLGLLFFMFVGNKKSYVFSTSLSFMCLFFAVLLMFGNLNMYLYLFSMFLLGLGFGGITGVAPILTSQIYGKMYQGISYGLVFMGYSFTGFIAPYMSQMLIHSSRRYFYTLFIVIILGFIINFLLLKVKKSKQKVFDNVVYVES